MEPTGPQPGLWNKVVLPALSVSSCGSLGKTIKPSKHKFPESVNNNTSLCGLLCYIARAAMATYHKLLAICRLTALEAGRLRSRCWLGGRCSGNCEEKSVPCLSSIFRWLAGDLWYSLAVASPFWSLPSPLHDVLPACVCVCESVSKFPFSKST